MTRIPTVELGTDVAALRRAPTVECPNGVHRFDLQPIRVGTGHWCHRQPPNPRPEVAGSVQALAFWAELADTVVVGSKNDNEADEPMYFEGTESF
ncbi:hypothetical protein [Embleya sp. NPDC050493]|uniref:hypothetical protein n=1 Tax=Embleya sp. NPDC050493 TaxID=3363989 RepID=UPI0037B72EC5